MNFTASTIVELFSVSTNIVNDIETIARISTNPEMESKSSPEQFVKRLIKLGHESVLEHRSLRIVIPINEFCKIIQEPTPYYVEDIILMLERARTMIAGAVHFPTCKHLQVIICGNELLIEGNIHAWRDYFRLVDITPCESTSCNITTIPIFAIAFRYILTMVIKRYRNVYGIFFDDVISKTPYNSDNDGYPRIVVEPIIDNCFTLKLFVDMSVIHDFERHRLALTQSNIKFVRYNNLTYINSGAIFNWIGIDGFFKRLIWSSALRFSAIMYAALLKLKCKPQEAKLILPNSTAAYLYITGTKQEWEKLIKLRTSNGNSIQTRYVAWQCYDVLKSEIAFSFS